MHKTHGIDAGCWMDEVMEEIYRKNKISGTFARAVVHGKKKDISDAVNIGRTFIAKKLEP